MSGGISQFAAQDKPLADQLNKLVPGSVYKASNESYVGNTNLHNDAELFASVAANAAYTLEVQGVCSCVAAAAWKFDFSLPSGATYANASLWFPNGSAAAIPIPAGAAGALSAITPLDSANKPFWYTGTLLTGVNAGTVAFRWAQNASNGSANIIYAGAYMRLQRIG